MSKNYPRPFTPAWEKEIPRISVVGPKVISEKATLPIGIIDLSVTETFIPIPLFEPPIVIVEEKVVIIPQKAINYRNLILAGLSGGLMGTVIYVILRLLGAF